ncbi:MAG TPA: hypothetical protein VGG06_02910 [Thermoanaerobaculia bacterium]
MFKQLLELAKRLLLLTRETEENKSQIKRLQGQMESVMAAIRQLTFELHQLRDHESHEREKMALKLENAMLRFERRLPSGNPRRADPE